MAFGEKGNLENRREAGERLLLRVAEVASMIGVSRATAYDLVNRNVLPSITLRGRGGRGLLRVPAEALRKLIQERTISREGAGMLKDASL